MIPRCWGCWNHIAIHLKGRFQIFIFKKIFVFFSWILYPFIHSYTSSLQKVIYITKWSYFWRVYLAWNAKDRKICRLLVLFQLCWKVHTGTFKMFSSNKVLFSTFNYARVNDSVSSDISMYLYEAYDNLSILCYECDKKHLVIFRISETMWKVMTSTPYFLFLRLLGTVSLILHSRG